MPQVTAIVSRVTNRISLLQGHDYEVIGIDDKYFRIVDESGEPVLHPKSFFVDCEIVPPEDWNYRNDGEGEYAYDPPEFSAKGFCEDYADGHSAAVRKFRAYLQSKNLMTKKTRRN